MANVFFVAALFKQDIKFCVLLTFELIISDMISQVMCMKLCNEAYVIADENFNFPWEMGFEPINVWCCSPTVMDFDAYTELHLLLPLIPPKYIIYIKKCRNVSI